MSKVKVKTVMGATAVVLIFLVIMVAFLFYAFPESMASSLGLGPYQGDRILTVSCLVAIFVLLLGWVTEKLFDISGKSGLYVQWSKNKQQRLSQNASVLEFGDDQSKTVIDAKVVQEHLRLRYGRFWRRKVKLLLVQGQDAEIERGIPGLKQEGWQENDGVLLFYGGAPEQNLQQEYLASIQSVSPARPLDGCVLVFDLQSLPTQIERDNVLRHYQRLYSSLGWRVPVWLWLIEKQLWKDESHSISPIGAIFQPGATLERAIADLTNLTTPLREVGMSTLLQSPQQGWLLRVSELLQKQLQSQLGALLQQLMKGYAALQVQGVILSTEQVFSHRQSNTLGGSPAWQNFFHSPSALKAKKLGWNTRQAIQVTVLSLLLFWCVGSITSLTINHTHIRHAQETARIAANKQISLGERLKNQYALQEYMARLQYRQTHGAPWYTRFGLNQDSQTLTKLWPLYIQNHQTLMKEATIDELKTRLSAYVALPPASSAREQNTQQAYNALKLYLMLASTDHVDKAWLTQNLLTIWPERADIPKSEWQHLAPLLFQFWADNLLKHAELALKPDMTMVNTTRKILLKQIGQQNAEAGLYQDVLKQVASNWPDLTLMELVGDTDAQLLFSTDEIIPGVFTRQAWEEQVKATIDEVVNKRRNEIDWVLTDKTQTVDNEVSPEALKARLTERYFVDFGNSWLNMINSIQWHQATSLSEVIAQLDVLADVRQSPLVALMNTLAWQGQTGQKTDAIADNLVDSAVKLLDKKKQVKQFIEQNQTLKGPLDNVFGPILEMMEGKDGTGKNGNLSFQSWLARVTQVRLKLQQVSNASDPQAMAKMLAQTVFQGKTIDLTDTLDYSNLVAASLGQEWNSFGQSLFVQPLEQAWRQILSPAADNLNTRWQTTIVAQWNKAFAGRYPFKATGSDVSLPLLAQFLRSDSGRIDQFIKTNLGGIVHKEGNRWVVDPSMSQGLTINPQFLKAINQLADISDIVFAQGDANIHFELMARPAKGVAQVQLILDGQKLDYFNQMESWQSFIWPGESYYPGVTLNWQSVRSGMQIYANYQGNWGFMRLLEQAEVTQLDSSRYQLEWRTKEGETLRFILRSELDNGPLALLKLQQFRLPEKIFLDTSKGANGLMDTF
ncbi:ImcF-related family protein [Proteus mirabilis]|uniref:ImcF-related family protein n=1 Tax=Proteus mirabilis TaxID=584 RepID=UPI000F5BE1D3|nr:ImcF-related family protein [Proteus mirabilis]MBS3826070.1 type VI secretion protein VasK [Proteus mirabilis]MBS3836542.1 type VI secretion protein VasK [Proteus mirabilis]MDC9789673.1 ImcF-related family protein [Proteus mirabilis]RQW17256.1 type VI secretion protein VasK [Proteus mirabilis]